MVEIHGVLEAHPKFRGRLEFSGKEERGFRGHGSLAVDERVDPMNGHPKFLGKVSLADSLGNQKFMEQNLPRRRRLAVS